MDFDFIYNSLSETIPGMRIFRDEPMKNHTTFRIGGPAAIFAEPESEEQLAAAFRILREMGVEPLVIGRGSNLLVRDEGIEGAVIHLGDAFAAMEARGDSLYAQAGASLAAVASAALRESLTDRKSVV